MEPAFWKRLRELGNLKEQECVACDVAGDAAAAAATDNHK